MRPPNRSYFQKFSDEIMAKVAEADGRGLIKEGPDRQILMEIRRLVMESEAEHPAGKGSNGGTGALTFSGPSLVSGGPLSPKLLKRPSHLRRSSHG